ncbi:cellulose synthase subunit BcsC [Escherichia coli]|uniref:Cellulose synthase subunit BcsC n=1 Tax=Escherichia coli TaxID=562 RepID=A0A376RB67_ECOLX|nr:cellulose synthase subunit BcsC [Escherichia coli]
MSITPTAMRCWGWAMWRWRAKITPPLNAIISRPCGWTAATLMPCAGWRIFTASSRQKKLKRLSPRSLPASGVALMISNAACKRPSGTAAEALENQGKWAQAAALQRQRLALDPGSVWITYRLSQDLWQAGQRSQADTLMRNLAQQKPNDPEQVYAYGLYLSGHGQDRAALAHINSLPRAQWNSNIQELVNRLQSDQVLETANRLRERGKEAEAEAMLRQQPPSSRIDLTLADWAQQRRDYTAARAAYQNVLTREPTNADAILGLTEVDIAVGDTAAARSQLAKLPATDNASLNTQRRVALAQAQLGDTAAAQQTFNKLIPQAKSQPPSMESAMVLRDGAKFEAQAGDPTQALEPTKTPWLHPV